MYVSASTNDAKKLLGTLPLDVNALTWTPSRNIATNPVKTPLVKVPLPKNVPENVTKTLLPWVVIVVVISGITTKVVLVVDGKLVTSAPFTLFLSSRFPVLSTSAVSAVFLLPGLSTDRTPSLVTAKMSGLAPISRLRADASA